MGDTLKIRGGKSLSGSIFVGGSKNTILPCIAGALLTDGEVTLENVPDIRDVSMMLAIAEDLGVSIERDLGSRSVNINAKHLKNNKVHEDWARKLRGSLLFSGALLGRVRSVELAYPGGDQIGARPLDTHLHALRHLGIVIEEGNYLKLNGENLKGAQVLLEESSVTATENTILAAVLAPGKTEIHLAAQEPHVQELIKFLNSMGAAICWKDVGVLEIEGQKKLHATRYRINPDELEVSSFAALAAATASSITIRGIEIRYLDAVLLQLTKMGVEYRVSKNDLLIERARAPYKGFRLQSGLYQIGRAHV